MLKKLFLFAMLLSAASLSFAKNVPDSSLIVAPFMPSEWGYINATVSFNQQSSVVGNSIVLPVSVQDTVSLIKVAAMNAEPRIDDSCRNIQIQESGMHQLVFELKNDWIIHCQYSVFK